jgi:hypothetical protein
MDTCGISSEDLEKYRERFPSGTQDFMMRWQPRLEGPLDAAAPEARRVLEKS